MWKKVLREYFAFPKKERRAIWVLFIIWIVLLLFEAYQFHFLNNQNNFSYKIIVAEEFNNNETQKLKSQYENRFEQTKFNKKIYFNYVKVDELIKAGISRNEASTIIALRENGLKIYTLEDLEKLNNIDSSTKNILKSTLHFYPSKKYFNVNPNVTNTTNIIVKININTTDTLALDGLKGIGFGTARRVLRYKERLGGYINKEQLKEVWGMDSVSFEILSKSIYIDDDAQKHLNINTANVQLLGSHPYIGYPMAKLIVNYRNQHGNYENIKDLLKIHVMNKDIFSKIEPYISIKDD